MASIAARWQRHDDVLLPGVGFVIGVGAVVIAASEHANAVQLDVVRLAAWTAGPVAAALLLDRRPGNRVGRLLALAGFFPVLALVVAAWEQRTLPDITSAAAQSPVLALPAVALLVSLVAAFPDGAAASQLAQRVRHVPAGVAMLGGMSAAWRAAQPGSGGTYPLLERFEQLCLVTLLFTLLLVLGMQWRAASAATGIDRRRRLWLLVGALAVAACGAGIAAWSAGPAAAYASAALHALVPFGIALLVIAGDLPPVELALGQVGVTLAIGGVVVGVFAAAHALLSRTDLPDPRSAATIAAAVAALALLPLHSALRRRVAVRLLGVGRQPGSLLALLSESLQTTGEAQDALRSACDAVAAAVRSPSANVVPSDSVRFHDPAAVTIPLTASGEDVGMLVVAPRRPGESFTRRDVELMATLAAPVAQVARAAGLAAALERARADIAAQRLDERRRLRRDLHDGLGPLLASLALHADALVRAHPDLADSINRISETLAASRGEVRRLVEGLAPDAVVTGDLRHSLEELVEGWASAAAPAGLLVRLSVPEDVPPVSEEVRVAAYRIVGEALTNVVRHAKATECDVVLQRAPGGHIELEVRDNGMGVDNPNVGFGMRSMTQRAASVGGTVEVTTGQGTLVRLRIPALDRAVT